MSRVHPLEAVFPTTTSLHFDLIGPLMCDYVT